MHPGLTDGIRVLFGNDAETTCIVDIFSLVKHLAVTVLSALAVYESILEGKIDLSMSITEHALKMETARSMGICVKH